MRKPHGSAGVLNAVLCAALSAGFASCGGNGGGNGGGPTVRSGTAVLLVTNVGSPVDLGAPAYEFGFATEQVLTGTLGLSAGGDVTFMCNGFPVLFYFSTSGDGGFTDMGTVELSSITEAPESGYTSNVDLGGTEVDADWLLLVGKAFCVRTRDGAHYAKMKIVDADKSMGTITFDWVYLPDGGRVFP